MPPAWIDANPDAEGNQDADSSTSRRLLAASCLYPTLLTRDTSCPMSEHVEVPQSAHLCPRREEEWFDAQTESNSNQSNANTPKFALVVMKFRTSSDAKTGHHGVMTHYFKADYILGLSHGNLSVGNKILQGGFR